MALRCRLLGPLGGGGERKVCLHTLAVATGKPSRCSVAVTATVPVVHRRSLRRRHPCLCLASCVPCCTLVVRLGLHCSIHTLLLCFSCSSCWRWHEKLRCLCLLTPRNCLSALRPLQLKAGELFLLFLCGSVGILQAFLSLLHPRTIFALPPLRFAQTASHHAFA